MMQDGLQGQWDSIPEGLVVCIVASAPALQAGLRSMLSDLGMVDAVYSASSIEEVETYRSITDILFICPTDEDSAELEQVLDDSSLTGVVVLVADENERSRLIPENPDTAWGILPLTATVEQFEAALLAIASGLSIGPPDMVTFLKDSETPDQEDPLIDPLTVRETEVLQLLARGKANKQIALDLAISEHTVKFHISSIYTKLGAGNRTEAVRFGVRRGLVLL
jgi:NarL family two-component system response regulator YdfI